MKSKEEIDSALEKYRAKNPEAPLTMGIDRHGDVKVTGGEPKPDPRRPTRCRVKLPDRMSLPIIGGGSSAFDAEFDWDRMVAIGTVEGHTIMVGCQLAAIAFYKDGETR